MRHKIILSAMAVTLSLVMTWPYLSAWRTDSGDTPTGLFHLTTGDIPVYYSFIQQGREGKLVMENLYTAVPQTPAVFSPQWFVIGQLANLLNVSTPAIYQIMRVVLGLVLMWLIYQCIALVVAPGWQRDVTWIGTLITTGFGVLIAVHLPLQGLSLAADRWIPESSLFLTLYHNPLFIMALCLMLGAIWLFCTSFVHRSRMWGAALLVALLAFIHPYDTFIIGGTLVVGVIVRILFDRGWTPPQAIDYLRHVAAVLVPAGLVLVTQRLIFNAQPALRGWAASNVTLSPQWWWYVPAFGIPFILALTGIKRLIKRYPSPGAWLMVSWVLVVPILLYLPNFPYQRRMEEGWLLPLAIVGGYGVRAIWQALSHIIQSVTVRYVVGIGLAGLTTFFLVVTGPTHIATDLRLARIASEPMFIPSGVTQAYDWIRDHTPESAAILAEGYDGNLLPGWSGRRVYFGHSDLSGSDSGEKIHNLQQFFTPGSGFQTQAFIDRHHLDFLMVRGTDQAAQAIIRQGGFSARLVYVNMDAQVFDLRHDQ